MRHLFKEPEACSIDISPLIDIVFILLIFFMVSTTFVKDLKIDLERPAAKSAHTASSKAIRIQVDRSEAIAIDGQPVRLWALQGRLREYIRSGGGDTVLVITDRNVRADKLIQVVDQCRLAGAKDVGVAANHEEGV